MVRKIEWTLSSIQDRLEIYTYWKNRNKSTLFSEKLEAIFLKAANIIAENPLIGIESDYEGVRVKVMKGFKIFYSYSEDKIQILRVWDPRQNPRKLKSEIALKKKA